jgi:hypothetical protein
MQRLFVSKCTEFLLCRQDNSVDKSTMSPEDKLKAQQLPKAVVSKGQRDIRGANLLEVLAVDLVCDIKRECDAGQEEVHNVQQ